MARLLDIAREELPSDKNEWERVAANYNERGVEGWVERDYDSLRRRFKQLYSTRKPIGNPFIPPNVRTAKDIKAAIDDRVGAAVFEDETGDEDEIVSQQVRASSSTHRIRRCRRTPS